MASLFTLSVTIALTVMMQPNSYFSFVLDELAESIATLLLGGFAYVRGLNELGCEKLLLNVASLEQALCTITSGSSSSSLDVVRDYYTLASYGSMVHPLSQPPNAHRHAHDQCVVY